MAIPVADAAIAPVVYVSGAVKTPGLYKLAPDARLDAALQAAGGVLPQAATASLNLARRVKDEEMIVVPSQSDPSASASAAPSAPVAGAVNQADADQLQAAGLTEAQAKHLVEWGQSHGPVHSADEVRDVPGLSRSWRKVSVALGFDPGPASAHRKKRRRQ
jgi:competence protein ComEA